METGSYDDPDITFEGREKGRLTILAFVFAVVALLSGVDLVTDAGQGVGMAHRAAEGALFMVGLAGLAVMARNFVRLSSRTRRLEREKSSLSARMIESQAEAARWREDARSLLAGLGDAIDRQFDRWELSEAEKEVAMLLLKGLSHREISDVRTTTEATTRQQARAVYRKAGLTGRNDLAAFFLEDLLLPQASRIDEQAS